jgi:hypothetical protein
VNNSVRVDTRGFKHGKTTHGEKVLVRVDERVSDRRDSGVVERERDGGDGLDSGHELLDESRLLNVEDGLSEELSLVEDVDDLHS